MILEKVCSSKLFSVSKNFKVFYDVNAVDIFSSNMVDELIIKTVTSPNSLATNKVSILS